MNHQPKRPAKSGWPHIIELIAFGLVWLAIMVAIAAFVPYSR